MRGKETCRVLKEIRQKIADENDIPYVTEECGYKGECRGTCPKCESDLRYLEKQLAARVAAGKKIVITALCAGMALGVSGCTAVKPPAEDLSGDVEIVQENDEGQNNEVDETDPIEPSDNEGGSKDNNDEPYHLMGDVVIQEEK